VPTIAKLATNIHVQAQQQATQLMQALLHPEKASLSPKQLLQMPITKMTPAELTMYDQAMAEFGMGAEERAQYLGMKRESEKPIPTVGQEMMGGVGAMFGEVAGIAAEPWKFAGRGIKAARRGLSSLLGLVEGP